MRQHELTEKKSELLNCIKQSMWTGVGLGLELEISRGLEVWSTLAMEEGTCWYVGEGC